MGNCNKLCFFVKTEIWCFINGIGIMEEAVKNLIKEIEGRLATTAMRYYSNFYIGTVSKASKEYRLFTEHGLTKGEDWCISVDVHDVQRAREIKQYFLKKGMRGSVDDREEDATVVYCYVVTQYTVEFVKPYMQAMQ